MFCNVVIGHLYRPLQSMCGLFRQKTEWFLFYVWLYYVLNAILKLVTLGRKSKSLLQKMYLKLMKKIVKNSTINIFENKAHNLKEHFIAVILIPNIKYDRIVNKYSEKFAIKAALHPCANVYIYKPINWSEWTSYVPWVIKS